MAAWGGGGAGSARSGRRIFCWPRLRRRSCGRRCRSCVSPRISRGRTARSASRRRRGMSWPSRRGGEAAQADKLLQIRRSRAVRSAGRLVHVRQAQPRGDGHGGPLEPAPPRLCGRRDLRRVSRLLRRRYVPLHRCELFGSAAAGPVNVAQGQPSRRSRRINSFFFSGVRSVRCSMSARRAAASRTTARKPHCGKKSGQASRRISRG